MFIGSKIYIHESSVLNAQESPKEVQRVQRHNHMDNFGLRP